MLNNMSILQNNTLDSQNNPSKLEGHSPLTRQFEKASFCEKLEENLAKARLSHV